MAQHQRESVYGPDQMTGFSILAASERLRAKTKVREARIRDMLFTDDAVMTTHTQQELACTDGPFLSGLQGFQTKHQSEEDKRPEAGYNGTASHHHR